MLTHRVKILVSEAPNGGVLQIICSTASAWSFTYKIRHNPKRLNKSRGKALKK